MNKQPADGIPEVCFLRIAVSQRVTAEVAGNMLPAAAVEKPGGGEQQQERRREAC